MDALRPIAVFTYSPVIMQFLSKLKTWHFWLMGAVLLTLLAIIAFILRDDIKKDSLDPKIPFQIYAVPESPDYSKVSGWLLNPGLSHYYADPRKVDVFFIHGTTFNGGKHWLAPVSARGPVNEVQETQLPNYAAPFALMGNIYAPKYRQASLYSQFSMHEDAREAREFPYRDIKAAFETFLKTRDGGDGFALVGIEQGGLLAQRLLSDVINPDPALKSQLVGAYLLETPVPESLTSSVIPACRNRTETGCLLSYVTVDIYRPDKVLTVLQRSVKWVWPQAGAADAVPAPPRLMPMSGEDVVCVNPLLGAVGEAQGEARDSLGAANATGLDWPTQPALITHRVSAQCKNGLLIVTKPVSSAFDARGPWEDRKKVRSYNLFYGDLQADFKTRWSEYRARKTVGVPQI